VRLIPDLSAHVDWQSALSDVDVVFHLAARVHIMNESPNGGAEFERVNVDATRRLAEDAARYGVRRVVFLSSIKVNGEATVPGRPFTESDVPAPVDPYSASKLRAEDVLRDISARTEMEGVVVRPPLVYGPEVKANFARMMRWVSHGVPLPLGAITQNRRSLVGVDNLVDLAIVASEHPAAANKTFLVSDGEDLSTAELLQRVAHALGVKPRLIRVPASVLRAGANLLGQSAVFHRLCGNLQVDSSKARRVLGWRPPLSVDEGLRRIASAARIG
jgi:nucleoside-diphosphate-sugar epimerase